MAFAAETASKVQPVERLIYRVAPTMHGPMDLHLDIYHPEGVVKGTILFAHAGGFLGGSPDQAAAFVSELTTRGLAVVAFAYRLKRDAAVLGWPLAGQSRKLRDAVPKDFGLPIRFIGRPAHGATEDMLAALNWVADRGADRGLTPENLAVFGDSAGGIIALNTLFLLPSFGVEVPDVKALAVMSGALPNVARCDMSKGPPLIWTHGLRDARVNVASTLATIEACKGRGPTTSFHIVDHKAHGSNLMRIADGVPGETEAERRAVVWDFLLRHLEAA